MIPQVIRATPSLDWTLRGSAVSVLSLVIAASALGLGCDDCPTTRQVMFDHEVTGQLSYQGPGAASTTGDLAPFSGFDVGGGSAAYPGISFTFTFAVAAPSRSTIFSARLVVGSVPAGASEIELGDDVASLTIHTAAGDEVYHALTGRLQWVDSTCQTNCPLDIRGTVTVSATGPDQELFTVTSGAFVAADTIYEAQICQG
jgi:hypothetical protein